MNLFAEIREIVLRKTVCNFPATGSGTVGADPQGIFCQWIRGRKEIALPTISEFEGCHSDSKLGGVTTSLT